MLAPAVEGVAAFPAAEHASPAAEEAEGPADATPAGARISAERCARAREKPVEQASAVSLLGLLPFQGSQVGQRLVAPLVRHDYLFTRRSALVDAECPLVSPLRGHGMSAGGRGRYTTAHTLPPMPVTPHICHPGCHGRKRALCTLHISFSSPRECSTARAMNVIFFSFQSCFPTLGLCQAKTLQLQITINIKIHQVAYDSIESN